ncbi:hypothetical protein OEZ86_013802 [Tetradesmus obliquus]|nr:hypothetical protein OEZ86_013802 [Tetradesmus obliquus]
MASKGPPGMLTRRSISRPDSSGGRKEIPITSNSLDLLKPSPEQPTAGESRPSSAGPPRCKTPVGGAAPPRRSSSANRYANIQVLQQPQQQQQQQEQQHGGLPDDDSLVLYKDPSGLSMQQSVASVASGRHQEGETFFTALRRSFSSGSESELELQQAAAGGLSYVDSQANPICSPSTSAFFSARDEHSGLCSAGGSLQDEYSQAASMATCESSSTLYQEVSAAAAGPGLAPTASVLDQQLDSRLALQQELSGYVAGLAARLGDDGEQLVTLPADYQLMVERLLRERRSQYRALEGWEGPRRFDDLPVAQLPASHDDPKIAAGLEVIRQLDEQLKEAWIKAQVSARGSNPEHWAAAERERLAARAAQLDEALARERQKRLHAARLLRALHKLDEQQQADDALLLPGPCKGLSTYSYYKLQPQEEQLLAAVLGRDDAALEQHNPFDAFAACPDVEEGSVAAAAADDDYAQDVSSGNAAPAELEASCCTAQPCGRGTGDAAGAEQQGPPAAQECCGSGRPSSEGSSRSVASSSSKPKHTLAEIDALLEALQADHCAANGPGLGSSRPSIATLSSAPGSRRSTITKDATPAQAVAAAAQRPCRSGAGSASSVCSGASLQAQQQQQQQQQRDYVREQREAKELQQREQEVDAQLRALRISELPATLEPEQLQALLQQCRQIQAAAYSSAASLG